MFNQNMNNNIKNFDIIQNICMNNYQKNNSNSQKEISNDLKNKIGGEWIVAIAGINDNFEFNITDIPLNNYIVFQINQQNIYICRYV